MGYTGTTSVFNAQESASLCRTCKFLCCAGERSCSGVRPKQKKAARDETEPNHQVAAMLYVLLATLAAGVCSTPHTDAHSLMQGGDEEVLLQLQRTKESGYKYNASLLSIMIPEPRKLATIPLVVLHAHAYFPELQIQIRHSRANEEYVRTQPVLAALREKGAVVLTPMPDPFYRSTTLNPYEYSSMLEQKHFWLAALTRKVGSGSNV